MFWLISVALADPSGAPEGLHPIVNGQIEDGFPTTVALAYGPFVFCTGSLITPRVVLTAAHCLEAIPEEALVDNGFVLVGTESWDPKNELAIQRTQPHPKYVPLGNQSFGQTLPENDVGVVILRQDAPARLEPVWIRTEPLRKPEARDQVVVSVGYGEDENGSFGLKRSAELVVRDVTDQFLMSFNEDNANGANICSGDSGGPMFHQEDDGTWVQWGVHSWGDSRCSYDSGSTRVDVTADFVLDQIEKVHGTRDRCELFGLYENGVCDQRCDEVDPECLLLLSDIVANGSAEEPGGCRTAPAGGVAALALGGAATLLRRRRLPLNG